MKALFVLFLGSLLLGQIGAISLFPDVVVYAHDIFLVLLILVSLPTLVRNKKLRHAELLKSIGAFIGAGILSLLVNYWRFPAVSLLTGSLYLVRWAFYACLYILATRNFINPRFWLKGLYIVGVGFGSLGLLQFFLYPNLRNLMYLGWDPHYYRLFSTLLDPNFTGIILVLTLLLGFGILTKKNRTAVIACQVISFVGLLLTYSRSSFLALAAAIVVWAIMQKRWKLFIVLAAFTGVLFILPKIPGDTLKLTRLDSSLARIGNWQESFRLIAKAPVFGYGFDTLRYLNAAPSAFISKSAAGLDSSILFIFATTGVVGFAAYASLFISMIRTGRHTTFYIASLSALLVHSLFVNSLFYPWVMIWMWILTGAIETKGDPSTSSG